MENLRAIFVSRIGIPARVLRIKYIEIPAAFALESHPVFSGCAISFNIYQP